MKSPIPNLGMSNGARAGLTGFVAGLSRPGEEVVDAPVQMLRTLPFLALVPLFILWFGILETPKVALIAVGVCMALAFGAGSDGTGGMVIWPLFGTTNQLLAGLTLAVITVILIKLGRSPVYTLVPLVFLLAMSIYALLVQMGQFYRAENWLLLGMDVIILIAALWVTLEAIIAMRKGRDPAERAFEAQP